MRLEEGARPFGQQLANASLAIDFYSVNGLNWAHVQTSRKGHSFRFQSNYLPHIPLDYTIDTPEDLYVFSAPLHSALVCRQPAWRDFCPWACASKYPALHPVSDSTIEILADKSDSRCIDMLKEMKTHGYPVVVAEPPKPIGQVATNDGISPDIVLEVDRIWRRHVSRQLSEIGVPIIPVPDFTHRDGLTVEEYAGEGYHGNAKFGAAMMKQILRLTVGIQLH